METPKIHGKHGYRPSRWMWDKSPNDIFYRFTLDTPMNIEIRNYSELPSTYIYLVEEVENENHYNQLKVANGNEPYLAANNLRRGTYNVIVEGTLDNKGAVNNGIITTLITGYPSRVETDLGVFSNEVSQVVTGDTRSANNAYGDGARSDIYYKLELDRQMDLSVSLYQSELNDINIYLLNHLEENITNSQNGELGVKQL